MRYSVRLNDQAAADLADIVLFIARDNPAAAEKLGLALVETAFSLATFPYRGQQMKSRPKARKLIYGKYLMFTKYAKQTVMSKSCATFMVPASDSANRS
jgi:plasmid stabilization system protein ParE